MGCRIIRKRLPQFVQGLLPAAEARGMADHIQACAACRQETAEIKKVWTALGKLPAPETAVTRFPQVLERIDACEHKRAGLRWAWISLFRPSFASAAAAIMLIGFLSGALISALYSTDYALDPAADDSAYSMILSDAPRASFFDIYLQSSGQSNKENTL